MPDGLPLYQDIHQGSSYVGKVSFVMDPTKPVAQAFCTQPEAAAFLLVNNTCLPLGNPDYHTVPWQALLSTGVKQGRTSAPGAGPPAFCTPSRFQSAILTP